MPFGRIRGIIIDSNRRTKALSAIRASNKHDISVGSPTYRAHAGQHINIVVRTRAGAIDRQEHLTGKSIRINRVAHTYKTTKIDSGALVERWYHGAIFCVDRPNAPNLTGV